MKKSTYVFKYTIKKIANNQNNNECIEFTVSTNIKSTSRKQKKISTRLKWKREHRKSSQTSHPIKKIMMWTCYQIKKF